MQLPNKMRTPFPIHLRPQLVPWYQRRMSLLHTVHSVYTPLAATADMQTNEHSNVVPTRLFSWYIMYIFSVISEF